MANSIPTPANLTLPDPQGPAPFTTIDQDRWEQCIDVSNTAYGCGNIQIANIGFQGPSCTPASGSYTRFAVLRLPLISALHDKIQMRCYAYNVTGGYSRIGVRRPGSGTSFISRSNQITGSTPQWWTNVTETLTIPAGTTDYYEVEIVNYQQPALLGLSIFYLPGNNTTWPAAAGNVGTSVDGDFTPLDPAIAASSFPLTSGMAQALRKNAEVLRRRVRPIMFGFACETHPTPRLQRVLSTPKKALVPVAKARTLYVHAYVENNTAGSLPFYVQHGGDWREINNQWASGSSNNITRIDIPAGFTGWLNGTDGYEYDLLRDRSCLVARQPYGYPSLQPVGVWWDNNLEVTSYSLWDEEN